MAEGVVTTFLGKGPVVIFSKSYCPFCNQVKELFSSLGLTEKPAVLELDIRKDEDAVQDVLLAMTGGRSVPRVFIGGESVGGCDDTVAAHKSGKLAEMLKKAGALVTGSPSAIGAAGAIDLGPGLPDLGGFDLGGFDNIPLSENGQPPAWKYVQASVFQGLASQASPGVDNGTLMVQMSNVPNNPARAVAYQMQKRLDLQTLPRVEWVMPGVCTAVLGTVGDYITVTTAPELKVYCTPVTIDGKGPAMLGKGSKL